MTQLFFSRESQILKSSNVLKMTTKSARSQTSSTFARLKPSPYHRHPVGCQRLVDWVTCKERRRNARMLMERALSNPSWRRRSWLVVLRARRTRHLQARRWRRTRGRCALPLTVDEANLSNDSWPSGADDSFQQIVMKIVDLPEEELFRSIVFYI